MTFIFIGKWYCKNFLIFYNFVRRKIVLIDYSYLFDKARNLYASISYNDKMGKAVIPLRYFLDVTYRCNLSCPYCYLGTERKKDELSTQEWIDIINQIPRFGIISIIGGEPLTRKDFREIYIAASKRTPYRVNLYTNSLLMTESMIDDFIKYKLLCLSVSLDGYKETHDINRNHKGAFDKVINNLDLISEKSKNKHKIIIDVKTVLLENNIEDMLKLYELCSQKGYEFFSIAVKRNNFLKQYPCLKNELTEEFYKQEYPLELYFDMNKFKEVYKEMLKIAKHSKTKLRWAPKFKPTEEGLKQLEYLFEHGKDPVSELYKPCTFPFSNLFINPEGTIYPCLSVAMGSLKEQKLKDIINLPKYRCFRKNLKASKLFTGCQLCCEAYPEMKEENNDK